MRPVDNETSGDNPMTPLNPELPHAKGPKAADGTVPAKPVSEPAPLPGGPGGDAGRFEADNKCSPELLAWADRQYSDEEVTAGIREIRETGGLELTDFLQEIDTILSPDMSARFRRSSCIM